MSLHRVLLQQTSSVFFLLILIIGTGVLAQDGLEQEGQGRSLLISEFLASNAAQGGILDEDGESSDWLEIYNARDVPVDLAGWFLTDNSDNMTKWSFPEQTVLGPGEFLVVFASGKDRSGAELHTNFKLSASGEYLALVASNGVTVVHAYQPEYPQQVTDLSYGVKQYTRALVSSNESLAYAFPASEASDEWTAVAYEDATWQTAKGAIGFGFGGSKQRAFNDCVYRDDQAIGNNVTTYGLGGETSGVLVDQEAGEPLPITVSIIQSGGVSSQPNPQSGGSDCAPGTDAFITFGGLVDMTGVMLYGAAGWWVDLTFSGLDPGTTYTFATSAARNNYADRFTLYTLAGADTYTNASTSGVGVVAENKIRLNSGDNHNDGYVVRWTGITASDGTFTVRAQADAASPEGRKGYAFDCFMLEGGFSGANIGEQMIGNNRSVLTRIPFSFNDDIDLFDTLILRMKYEDGFIAFLNGVEVARDNVSDDLSAATDRLDTLAESYVSFDLSHTMNLLEFGQNLLAVQAFNDAIDDGQFLVRPELMLSSSTGVRQYFIEPTPGVFNTMGALDIVRDTSFSVKRGFYTEPFEVTISCDTVGAEIRYTMDGSAPSETQGDLYITPIPISGTTCLRALAVKPGWMSSHVDTQTYVFLADCITQSELPAGMPSTWRNEPADYGMDPDIVTHPVYGPLLEESLLSLPTMSLVMQQDDLFGSAQGIYANPNNSGSAWERPGSVELIYPDGEKGFQVNCGVRLYGGVGRNAQFKKHSFRLMFKREYGATKLRYPLFGEDAADEFDSLILRSNFNDAYVWGGDRSQYIRDEFVRRLQLVMGHPSPHGNFVHLYVNGLYWGLYNPVERPEASFSATYFDGAKEDWDAYNSARALGESGSGSWNGLLNAAHESVEYNAGYQKIQGNFSDGSPDPDAAQWLEMTNYIDYLLLNFFVGNRDWPGHNWYAAFNREDPSGFKWFSWDAEWVVGMNSGVNDNMTGTSNSLCEPYARLRENTEFRLLFADRVQQAFSYDGPFYVDPLQSQWNPQHPERNRPAALYAQLADHVEKAIVAESARWGDVRNNSPYTLNQWESQRDWILGSYMPQRSANVLKQLRAAGLYPEVEAPGFMVNFLPSPGGHVPQDAILLMSAPQGRVFYTFDGTDPRLPVHLSPPGEVHTLVKASDDKQIFVPTSDNGGDELGNTPAQFLVTLYKANVDVGNLDVAESVIRQPQQQHDVTFALDSTINYHNTSASGRFDQDKTFPGMRIGTDEDNFVVLVTGTMLISQVGPWTFGVNSDDGFGLTLQRGNKTFNLSHAAPRGASDTLGIFNVEEAGTYQVRLVYYERGGGAGCEFFAAPGQHTSFNGNAFHLVGDPAGGLLLGEGNIWYTDAMDDEDWSVGGGTLGYDTILAYEDFIDVDMADQMLGVNASCYVRIPFETSPAEMASLTLDVQYDDGFVAYLNGVEIARRFAPDELRWDSHAVGERSDDEAVLYESIDVTDFVSVLRVGHNLLAVHALNVRAEDTDFLFNCELVAQEQGQGGVSASAIEFESPLVLTDSVQIKARAFDGQWSALVEAIFAVGPVSESLRVTEIMYHPQTADLQQDPNTEFIELQNVGPEPIHLNRVSFTNGIGFTCPSVTLAAGEYAVIVNDLARFLAAYGDDVPVIGEYQGNLSNRSERIELVDAAGLVIQSLVYQDDWYPLTDGKGYSLIMTNPGTTDPSEWHDKATYRSSVHVGGSPGSNDI